MGEHKTTPVDHSAENVENAIATIIHVFLVILSQPIASALPTLYFVHPDTIELIGILAVSNFPRM